MYLAAVLFDSGLALLEGFVVKNVDKCHAFGPFFGKRDGNGIAQTSSSASYKGIAWCDGAISCL